MSRSNSYILIAISGILFVAVVALSIRALSPASPVSDGKPASDPVSEFKKKVENLDHPPEDILYVHITYDVQKSDSLISPYIATVKGSQHILSHGTQKTAYVFDFLLTAGYRDGEWTFESLTGTTYGTEDYRKMAITEDSHEVHEGRNLISTLQLKHEYY